MKMRLFVLNVLLLTTVAIASSEERHKRHLPMLIKLIKTLFGPEDTIVEEAAVSQPRPEYEVFRIPGHDNVMVKVSPKILNAEGVVYREVEPVNLRAFGTVVGIKSPDDTIAAVREVDNLLSSGILYGGYDDVMRDHIVAMFPGIRTVEEEMVPVIQSRPVISEVITPLEEQAELEVPLDTDSYEQTHNHEQATIITANTKPGTELVETIKNNELPDCIRKRTDSAVLLGAHPYKYERVEDVYPAPEVSVAKPIHLEEVQVNFTNDGKSENEKLTAFTNIGKEVNISETLDPIPSGYLERMNYTASLKNDKLKSIIIVPNNETIVSKRVESVALPANSLKLLKSLEDVQVSVSKDSGHSDDEDLSSYTSAGEKVDIFNTLGPIPYPYSKHIEVTENLKTNDQPKPVVISPSKEDSLSQDVEKNVVPHGNWKPSIEKQRDQEKADQIAISKENEPSSHFEILKVPDVHKKEDAQVKPVQISSTRTLKPNNSDGKDHGHINVNHPHPIKVNQIKESDVFKTNVKTNKDNNLRVVTPVKIELDKADTAQSKYSEQDEKVPEPKRLVDSTESSINPLKTNEVKFLQNPVLGLNNVRNKEDAHQKYFKISKSHEKTYSYQQKKAGGSSINVEADKDVTSVDFKGRGDIPEK